LEKEERKKKRREEKERRMKEEEEIRVREETEKKALYDQEDSLIAQLLTTIDSVLALKPNVVILEKPANTLCTRLEGLATELRHRNRKNLDSEIANPARAIAVLPGIIQAVIDAHEVLSFCTCGNWLRFLYVDGPNGAPMFQDISSRIADGLSPLGVSTGLRSIFRDVEADFNDLTSYNKFLESNLELFRKGGEEILSSLVLENFKLDLPNIVRTASRYPKFNRVPRILKDVEWLVTSPESELNTGGITEIQWNDLEIGAKVGQGAFAEVFEGYRAGERVAVKRLQIQDPSHEAAKMFLYEMRLLSQLHSNHIVTMYGGCSSPPNICVVLEFLEAGSVYEMLHEDEVEMPWDMRWGIAKDAAIGLNYLHRREPEIHHRDFKSSNLLTGNDGRVKVSDFGLSVSTATEITPGETGGSTRWTAPEVLDIGFDVYTEKSDVYSYGVSLWEIATRKNPWEKEDTMAVPKLVGRGERPKLTGDDIPREFSRLIEMCWHASPDRRPTFAEIIDYIDREGPKGQQRTQRRDTVQALAETQKQLSQQIDELRDSREQFLKGSETKSLSITREHDHVLDLEKQIAEMERRISSLEREKNTEVERVRDEGEKKAEFERLERDRLEKKRAKLEKRSAYSKRSSTSMMSSTDDRKAEFDRKIELERQKNTRLEGQVRDLQAELDQEERARADLAAQKEDWDRKEAAERAARKELECKKLELESAIKKIERRMERYQRRLSERD